MNANTCTNVIVSTLLAGVGMADLAYGELEYFWKYYTPGNTGVITKP